jgi:hypothetical protein
MPALTPLMFHPVRKLERLPGPGVWRNDQWQ